MHPRPPALIENMVRLLVPPASREHVMGDLSERYRSSWRYLLDAFNSLPLIIASQVRRTLNIGRLGVVAVTLFFLLSANRGVTWVVAALPTLLATAALILRDAYRTPSATPFMPTERRLAAVDVAVAAACIFLWQALACLFAPQWLLPPQALSVGIPVFCVLLFFIRLQAPHTTFWPPAIARTMSINELMAEVRGLEALGRRAIRIEIGAAFVLVTICVVSLFAMPPTLLGQAFNVVTASGALFVAWFLHRHARTTPVPAGRGFAQSVALYRRNLELQLQRARSVLWWYLVPLSCGPAVLMFGIASRQAYPWPFVIKGLAGLAALWGLILYMYQGAQQKLRRRIAQLDATAEKS
ncbi:MAG TPA: hypothetical protein VI653_30570 [Steroidobacteraceae bacterium]